MCASATAWFACRLKWALTAHTEIPELPEADVPGFLQIEAERGFHADAATMYFSTSQYSHRREEACRARRRAAEPRGSAGEGAARREIEAVEFFDRHDRAAAAAAEKSNSVLALVVGESSVGLQITCGGGIAALRALEGTVEMEGGRRVLHADVVVREARITFGQLPPELREKVRTVRIFGPRDFAQQLADELELKLEQWL